MNPWTIIGWIILWWFFFIFITVVGTVLALWANTTIKHLRTRNIEPAKGQEWCEGSTGFSFEIKKILSNGSIVMGTPDISWFDTHEQWKSRVKNCKLWLMKQ